MTCLPPGTVLRSRYRIVEFLGQGSMATVYRVRDETLETEWALKTLGLQEVPEEDQLVTVELFMREADTLARLAHPAFPLVREVFHEGELACLVMELVEGRSLEDIVSCNGPTPEGYLLPLAQELAVALDLLHRAPGGPIIFRDLKPSNVMVADDGTVKLVDFGIARIHKPGKAADTHPLGTPGFAAPEQWGSAQTTPRSDLYALGATLYYALTGTDAGLPGQPHPLLRQRAPGCSEKMEAIIESCLQQDPEQRPPSAAEVLRELETIPPSRPLLGAPRRRQGSLRNRWARSHGPLRAPRIDRFAGCGCLAMISLFVLFAGVSAPWPLLLPSDLPQCERNLREIETRLRLYATENHGRYPNADGQVGWESCPAGHAFGHGEDSYVYQSSSHPPAFTVVCKGRNHTREGLPEDFPRLTSRKGLQRR